MALVELSLFADTQYQYVTQLDGLVWTFNFLYAPRLGYYLLSVDNPLGERVVSGRALTANSYHVLEPMGGPPGPLFLVSQTDREAYVPGDITAGRVRLYYQEVLVAE